MAVWSKLLNRANPRFPRQVRVANCPVRSTTPAACAAHTPPPYLGELRLGQRTFIFASRAFIFARSALPRRIARLQFPAPLAPPQASQYASHAFARAGLLCPGFSPGQASRTIRAQVAWPGAGSPPPWSRIGRSAYLIMSSSASRGTASSDLRKLLGTSKSAHPSIRCSAARSRRAAAAICLTALCVCERDGLGCSARNPALRISDLDLSCALRQHLRLRRIADQLRDLSEWRLPQHALPIALAHRGRNPRTVRDYKPPRLRLGAR